MRDFLDDFFYYYNNIWSKREENVWRSFTYGVCFYDWVKEGHLNLWDVEREVNDYIQWQSWADRERIENLDDATKVELVDCSYLRELIDEKINEAQEEQQEELFDELDDETYKLRDDLEKKVGELIEDYPYIEKSVQDLCDEYEDDRDIDYQEQCFDELDSYHFVERSEVVGAIQDYFYPDAGTDWEQPSYWELAIYTERADEYIDDRGLEFDEEEEK